MWQKIWLFIVVCNFFWSIPATAQEMIIITEEYPPLSYTEDGIITGASTEIVKEILRRLDQMPVGAVGRVIATSPVVPFAA